MKEIISDQVRRGYTLIKALGIVVLTLLMMVGIVSATPFAYITNTGDNTVSVIDTATNTVSPNPIYVGNAPYGVAVSLDGTRAYVTNEGSFNVAGTVSVIDTSNNNVIDTYTVEKKPMGIAINPSGTKVYVANYVSGTVSVIDTVSKTIKPVTVGMGPVGVAISPDGSKVYVTNELSYTVSEIDIATDTVNPNPIYVGMQPWGIAVTPDGSKAYVANEEGHTVSVINTATRDVKPVSLGGYNIGIAVSPDGSEVYVTSEDDNDAGSVYVIDTATDTVVLPPIQVGKLPTGVAFSRNGNYAYVANSGSNTVSVIDTATNTVTQTVTVGKYPVAFGQFISPKLKANFSWSVSRGTIKSTVLFKDTSAGNPTSWSWNFGIPYQISGYSNPTSTQQNPSYAYYAGTYNVTLTVKNAAGDSSKISKQINVTTKQPPIWGL